MQQDYYLPPLLRLLTCDAPWVLPAVAGGPNSTLHPSLADTHLLETCRHTDPADTKTLHSRLPKDCSQSTSSIDRNVHKEPADRQAYTYAHLFCRHANPEDTYITPGRETHILCTIDHPTSVHKVQQVARTGLYIME